MNVSLVIIVALSAYVATRLIYEGFDDPLKIIKSISHIVHVTPLRDVLDCPYCLSFWTTQFMSIMVSIATGETSVMVTIIHGLAAYGLVFGYIRKEEMQYVVQYEDEDEDEDEGSDNDIE